MSVRILSATALHIEIRRSGNGQTVNVFDGNTGNKIGIASRIRGFIQYTGVKYSAHEGMEAVIRSNGPDYSALQTALAEGLRNGRDDRS